MKPRIRIRKHLPRRRWKRGRKSDLLALASNKISDAADAVALAFLSARQGGAQPETLRNLDLLHERLLGLACAAMREELERTLALRDVRKKAEKLIPGVEKLPRMPYSEELIQQIASPEGDKYFQALRESREYWRRCLKVSDGERRCDVFGRQIYDKEMQ